MPSATPVPVIYQPVRRAEALVGHEELTVGGDGLTAGRGHAHRVPVIARHQRPFGEEHHRDLGVVGRVVVDGEEAVGGMHAPGRERPRPLDHPAAVDPAGAPRHAPALPAHGEGAVADPRGLVDGGHGVIRKGQAPLVAAGCRPHHPGGRAAARAEGPVEVVQLAGTEVGAGEAFGRGETEDAGRVEPRDRLLGHAPLELRRRLMLAQPGSEFDHAAQDLLRGRLTGGFLDHAHGHLSSGRGTPSNPATGRRLGSLPSRIPPEASGWSSNHPSAG
jgi:hypothetical protein